MLERSDFFRELLILAEIHNRTFSEPVVEAYWQAIQWAGEDGGLVIEAMVYLRKSEFMPKPFHIDQRVRYLRERRTSLKALPYTRPSAAEIAQVEAMLQPLKEQMNANRTRERGGRAVGPGEGPSAGPDGANSGGQGQRSGD